jgi:N-acylneuraminate cytidylyltransferase
MKPLIVIPARGGSKGIPRKNIKLLGGRPLIAYSIDVAMEVVRRYGLSQNYVILSTDDEEISAIATTVCGLKVNYRRPAALATDTAGSREVILDAMDYAANNGVDFDCVLLLQPTSPFRSFDDVEGCLQLFNSKHPDMAVSVKQASANPYYNCFETDDNGALHISKGDGKLTRRQDAPKAWEFNGAVYVINIDSIRQWPLGEFPVRIPYEMPAIRSIDLDTPLDWAVAEAILSLQNNGI